MLQLKKAASTIVVMGVAMLGASIAMGQGSFLTVTNVPPSTTVVLIGCPGEGVTTSTPQNGQLNLPMASGSTITQYYPAVFSDSCPLPKSTTATWKNYKHRPAKSIKDTNQTYCVLGGYMAPGSTETINPSIDYSAFQSAGAAQTAASVCTVASAVRKAQLDRARHYFLRWG